MTKAFLEITLTIAPERRAAAGGVYAKYREPFLSTTVGAQSKQLLHGFDSKAHAEQYLQSPLFQNDVVVAL